MSEKPNALKDLLHSLKTCHIIKYQKQLVIFKKDKCDRRRRLHVIILEQVNYARSKFSRQNSSKEFQWKSVCGLIKKLEIMLQRKYYCYASSRCFSSVLCRQILTGPTLCTIQLLVRYHSYFYVSAFTYSTFLIFLFSLSYTDHFNRFWCKSRIFKGICRQLYKSN